MSAGNDGGMLDGIVEVDGAHLSRHVRPENRKEDRRDRRLSANRDADRRVMMVLRQRGGRTLPFVVKREAEGAAIVRQRVALGSELHVDEAPHWDGIEFAYATHRINHGQAYSADGACTNQAESYFSRLRRAIVGQHHHVSKQYLHQYANEAAWREDNRREANGTQHHLALGAALHSPIRRRWKGYWQRGA